MSKNQIRPCSLELQRAPKLSKLFEDSVLYRMAPKKIVQIASGGRAFQTGSG